MYLLVGHCNLHVLSTHGSGQPMLGIQALCIPSAAPSASKQLPNAVLSHMIPQLGTSTAVTSGSCCSAAVLVSSMTASTSTSTREEINNFRYFNHPDGAGVGPGGKSGDFWFFYMEVPD